MSKKHQSDQRGNGSLITIGIIVISVLLLSVLVIFFSKSNTAPEITVSNEVEAISQSTSHDWGTISMKDGGVEAVFEVKNNGSEMLQLYDATTSCSCTTAQLVLGETKSPLFGMHTNFNYVLEVPSGETAQVKVVFDPAFHGPTGVGQISREVTVETNDAARPQLTFNASADVTR
jgi:hypothetical protein